MGKIKIGEAWGRDPELIGDADTGALVSIRNREDELRTHKLDSLWLAGKKPRRDNIRPVLTSVVGEDGQNAGGTSKACCVNCPVQRREA